MNEFRDLHDFLQFHQVEGDLEILGSKWTDTGMEFDLLFKNGRLKISVDHNIDQVRQRILNIILMERSDHVDSVPLGQINEIRVRLENLMKSGQIEKGQVNNWAIDRHGVEVQVGLIIKGTQYLIKTVVLAQAVDTLVSEVMDAVVQIMHEG